METHSILKTGLHENLENKKVSIVEVHDHEQSKHDKIVVSSSKSYKAKSSSRPKSQAVIAASGKELTQWPSLISKH